MQSLVEVEEFPVIKQQSSMYRTPFLQGVWNKEGLKNFRVAPGLTTDLA